MKISNLIDISNHIQLVIQHSVYALVTGCWLLGETTLAAPPANDNFNAAIDLEGNSGNQSLTSTIEATPEVGEPSLGAGHTNTVWFKWTAIDNGSFTIDTEGSTNSRPAPNNRWDAVLGVYSGAALSSLVPFGEPLDLGYPETITVPVSAGQTYFIHLAGYLSQTATNINLNWFFVPALYDAKIITFGSTAPVSAVVQNAASFIWVAPYGSDLSNAAPTFTLSPGATCNRVSGVIPSPNFGAGPVVYTVTSQGPNSIVNNYTVTAVPGNSLRWGRPDGGVWDPVTPNWIKQPAIPSSRFVDGDDVHFDNDGGGEISILSDLSPHSTTVSAAAGNYTMSGAKLAGTGSLIKNNGGSLTLDGINTYSGSTNVNGGTLTVDGTLAISGSTRYSVANGAILALTGTSSFRNSWPEKSSSLTGAGRVDLDLGGQTGVTLKFDMSAFTGSFNMFNGKALILPDFSIGFVSPINGTINVGTGSTLYLGWVPTVYTANIMLSSETGNGEGLGALRGDNSTLKGTIKLNTNSTIGTASSGDTFAIDSIISDGGNRFGFTAVGSGAIILNSPLNTYTGPTIVQLGATLRANTAGALGTGPLSIDGILNPSYAGTKTVASLTIGGVAQAAAGTYGSTSSGAIFKNDVHFTPGSTGTVTVAVSSKFDLWIRGYTFTAGADITPAGDADRDGVTNFQEYAFALDPSLSSSFTPISQQLNALTGDFEYTRLVSPASTGIVYTVLTSTDLVTWSPVGATETGSTISSNVETVAITVAPPTVAGKMFVKVQAVLAP